MRLEIYIVNAPDSKHEVDLPDRKWGAATVFTKVGQERSRVGEYFLIH
jgi:hypothetical protein